MNCNTILSVAALTLLVSSTAAFAGPTFTETQFDAPAADNPAPGTTVFTGISPSGNGIVGYFLNPPQSIFERFVDKNGTLTVINNQPGFSSLGASNGGQPFGINDSGVVSGDVISQTNPGFIFNGTSSSLFTVPGSIETLPGAINNAGVVTGEFIDNTPHANAHASTENQNGTGFTQIDVPGGTTTIGF